MLVTPRVPGHLSSGGDHPCVPIVEAQLGRAFTLPQNIAQRVILVRPLAAMTHLRICFSPFRIWLVKPETKKNTLVAGVLVIAVAGALLVWKVANPVSCKLAAAGVGLIATAILDGKGAAQIAGTTISGVVIPDACESAIGSFIEDPDQRETLVVTAGSGERDVTTSGSELLNPQPRPDLTDLIRQIQCRRYDFEILYAWCLEGSLDPPAAS